MKLTKQAWILWSVTLVVVLVLAFTIPFEKTILFYVALACTILMFGACALIFRMAFRAKDTLESKLLGWPLFKVGYVSLGVQTVLGFILMALSKICSLRIAVIVEVLVFAGMMACLTVRDAAREVVTQSEAQVVSNTDAWKAIRTRAAQLTASNGNPEMKKLAEEIRFSDPTPNEMDADIRVAVESLTSDSDTAAIAAVRTMIAQRKVAKR